MAVGIQRSGNGLMSVTHGWVASACKMTATVCRDVTQELKVEGSLAADGASEWFGLSA